MDINAKTRWQIKLQNNIFYLLVVVAVSLLAQLSLKTNSYADWTANSRHSLSVGSIDFLNQLDKPITIQVFANANYQYRKELERLLKRYQQYTDKLTITYTDPDFSPELVRKFNIRQNGEMVVSMNETMQKHVFGLSEKAITNALITVSRLEQRWLIFIEGHAERSPFGQANFDLATWGGQLEDQGFKLQALNLIKHSQIPENAAAVIIASPNLEWLEGEVEILKSYIKNGGSLLWLAEPNANDYLISLAEELGIEFSEGVIIDPNTESLGIKNSQFTLIADYGNHSISANLKNVTLFPQAAAIEINAASDSDWRYIPLLTTADNTWSEVTTAHNPLFDLGEDTRGPLTIGYLLSREHDEGKSQRIAVVGDGDFLSNTYIGNGGNLDLGIALMNWLAGDDDLITIPVKKTIGSQLELTKIQSMVIGLGFFILMPALLLIIGFAIWWYRRRR